MTVADGAVHEDTDEDLKQSLHRLDHMLHPLVMLPMIYLWSSETYDALRERYPSGLLRHYIDGEEPFQLATVVEALNGCWGRSFDLARLEGPSEGIGLAAGTVRLGRHTEGASAPPDSCRTAEGGCDGSCGSLRLVGRWDTPERWVCGCRTYHRPHESEVENCSRCGAHRPPLIEQPARNARQSIDVGREGERIPCPRPIDERKWLEELRARTAHLRYGERRG